MDYSHIKYLIEKESLDAKSSKYHKLTEEYLTSLSDEDLAELYELYHRLYRLSPQKMTTSELFNLKSLSEERNFRFLK